MSWKVAILTISDKASIGEREDTSAVVIRELIEDEIGGEIVDYRIVPDVMGQIMTALIEMSDEGQADLILTTGGTGLARRDVTPEATLKILDRQAPGFVEAMRQVTVQKNPRAMLSRAVSGIRGNTLIINLPGSPKGVQENLMVILDQLPHGLSILTNKAGEHHS